MKYLYIWLIIINIITFAVFGIDKKKAIDAKFRFSESALVLLSILVAWSALIAWLVLKTQYDFRTLKACLSGCFSLQTCSFVCRKAEKLELFSIIC